MIEIDGTVPMAYRRDASWQNTIGVGYAYHMPSESDPVLAACSRRIMLIMEYGEDAAALPDYQRCRRAACRNRWPGPTVP